MAQQGGSGNNTPIRPVGDRPSTPPRAPGAETPPSPPTPVTPPPQPELALSIATPSSGGKRPISPNITKSSCICPVCGKELYHEKALNGHNRWHTHKEREAAAVRVARALALSVVLSTYEEGSSSKRHKVPDLNSTPPPEDEE